jgi:hypothetical protein
MGVKGAKTVLEKAGGDLDLLYHAPMDMTVR